MTDLIPFGRRINEREATIARLVDSALRAAAATVAEMILQGQDLRAVKAALSHGAWLAWLSEHCPALHERRAQRYMRLAADPSRVAELMGAGSLRSALALLEEPAEASGEEPRRWPAYIEATGRVAKLAGYVEKHPVSQWPLEGQEKFRDELRPIVKALWPGLEV